MVDKKKRRWLWLWLVAAGGALAWFALARLASIGLAMAAVALSGLAAAATATVKGGPVVDIGLNFSAAVGSLAGSAMVALRLRRQRSSLEVIVLTLVNMVAAYFGGLAVQEALNTGKWLTAAGTIGIAVFFISTVDGIWAVLADDSWLKKLIAHRLGMTQEKENAGE